MSITSQRETQRVKNAPSGWNVNGQDDDDDTLDSRKLERRFGHSRMEKNKTQHTRDFMYFADVPLAGSPPFRPSIDRKTQCAEPRRRNESGKNNNNSTGVGLCRERGEEERTEETIGEGEVISEVMLDVTRRREGERG
ncbi:hypothetical protein K0M31_009326 [Melipona bicolor]|uniref:Uncharacterized protein n=1 Tax=Melipona bicolor TaxID=60889 RepID=A0AA40FPW0_9HYME|nr:hypothetical protein K0M31_009326 [Melipona bicolor]